MRGGRPRGLRARGPGALRLALTTIGTLGATLILAASAFGADRVYWSSQGASAIRVGNLDGTGAASNLFAGESNPRGVAIDPAAGRIYWANAGNGTIRVANLDGTGAASNLFGGEINPQGVAIDPAAGRIYWANQDAGEIRVGNLDGTGTASDLFSGETFPFGVAIDPAAGRIYWANQDAAAIRVGNLDGTGTASDLFSGESDSRFVALLRAPVGAGAPAISGGGEVGQELACGQGSWAPDLLGSFLYRAPRSFAYQWLKDGTDIDGVTQATHTPTEPGEYSCRVTAINQAGSTSQTSAPRTITAAPTPPPDPPPTPTPPSIEITGVKLNEQKGIAKLTVEFDPSGSLRIDQTNKVKGTEPVEVDGPGTAELTIAARGKGLKRLARTGQVTVNPRALFESPDGAIGVRHRFKLRADVTPGTVCLDCWDPS